jgi:metal-sulfur cluster biosynthetic enzyme
MSLDNPNPEVFERRERQRPVKREGEPLDGGDVFEFIRDIQDPEHPYSLEQLNVVKEELISLDHDRKICTCVQDPVHALLSSSCSSAPCFDSVISGIGSCRVQFTPTIDHCSLATLIGLCIRTQLMRKLPRTYKLDISV